MEGIWIIDIEASGLDRASYPIEVGAVCENYSYESLIAPEPGWDFWCELSEGVHSIKRQHLVEGGRPAIKVAKRLNEMFAGSRVYSDCKQWDGFWLEVLFGSVGITQNFNVVDLTELLTITDMMTYQTAYNDLLESDKYRHHRALDDAQIIYQALKSVGRV